MNQADNATEPSPTLESMGASGPAPRQTSTLKRIAVGALLLGLLAAGAYWVRQRSALTAAQTIDLSPTTITRAEINMPDLADFVMQKVAAVLKDTNDADAWLVLGEVYVTSVFYERAIGCFSNVILLKPDNGRAYYLRAIAEDNLGYRDLALADFDKALEIQGYVPSYWRKGMIYLELDKPDLAMATFTAALRKAPTDYPSQVGVARALLALDQPEIAGKTLVNLLNVQPRNDGYIYFLLATALQRTGDQKKSAEMRALSVEGMPSFEDPWLQMAYRHKPSFVQEYNQGQKLLREGKYDQSLEIFLSQLERDPKSSIALTNVSAVYVSERQWDKAEDYAQRALDIKPGDVFATLNVAKIRLGRATDATDPKEREKWMAEAETMLNGVLARTPSNTEAIALGADLLLQRGKVDEAIVQYKKAFDGADSITRSQAVQWLFHAGQLESMQFKWDDSIKTLKRVVVASPENGEAHFRLAMAYWVKGDGDNAYASYLKAKRYSDRKDTVLQADIVKFEEQAGIKAPAGGAKRVDSIPTPKP